MTLRPICKAAVQEDKARAPWLPRYWLMTFSKRSALGPVVSQPELKASVTAVISKGPIFGGEKLTKFFNGLRLPMRFDRLASSPGELEWLKKFDSRFYFFQKKRKQSKFMFMSLYEKLMKVD
jgi:hypothetical protein